MNNLIISSIEYDISELERKAFKYMLDLDTHLKEKSEIRISNLKLLLEDFINETPNKG